MTNKLQKQEFLLFIITLTRLIKSEIEQSAKINKKIKKGFHLILAHTSAQHMVRYGTSFSRIT